MRLRALPILLLPLLAACSGGKDEERPAPVPRPRAYPRAALYPESYHRYALPNGIVLNVNDSARLVEVQPGWFDIAYPAYNVTINCTLSTEKISETLDNRTERMARNLEGNYGEVIERPGVVIVTSTTALRTPVQFLATDSAGYVLSGVAVANYPASTAPDSVAPYIRALTADVIKLLERI